ncbi:MAG TPA: hypothetical protein VG456_05970 [Candidatus Sulfopaludibacter sp.]|jgi:hypothetical protein|nr:hypothetical protein [Candidatus Sulfopaludibacter sp.]
MRKWLITILAVPAALLPLAAAAQVRPEAAPANAPEGPKYGVYAGFSYTSLNQVNQSRYGLLGGNAEVTRNFGRFFAVVADGGFYQPTLGTGNPGHPTVSMGFLGPEIHGQVFENWSVFAHGLLGVEHTGGENMIPSTSFAGGLGGGVEHGMGAHWALRASGDDIAASFSLINNSPQLGYSPHRTLNARASVGVMYRF